MVVFLLVFSMINGRVLYVDGHEIWLAVNQKLLKSNDAGSTWELRAVLPLRGFREQLTLSRLGRRLTRSGYHHFIKTGADSGVIIAHQHVFQLREGDRALHRVASLNGSRPLSVCLSGDRIYYGEYRQNSERSQTHIWASDLEGRYWQPVWCFNNIRHVHGIFYDPYTSYIWVTTGDTDQESAIWVTKDQFCTLDYVTGGSQQHRVVQLLFTQDSIYFGSDAPEEKNIIYRMIRDSNKIEVLCSVSGPVFYGTKVGHNLFFSTAVEPSTLNTGSYTEIWGSANGENWKRLKCYKKDNWSIKYFQNGQILFPAGPGDSKNLIFTPIATEHDLKTFIEPIRGLL